MKQLLQDLRTGETMVSEVPVPEAGPGRILVRVCASAVSAGTERMLVEFSRSSLLGKAMARKDLLRQLIDRARRDGLLATFESATGRLAKPLPLGYSCAGIVEAAGDGVCGFKPGDRVACAGAGYANHAEFVSVPESLCVGLPAGESPSFEEAAFVAVAAIALHGLRLGRPTLGENVAVVGLGLIGQFAVQFARASGCRVFGVDLDPARVKLALELGASEAATRDRAEDAGRAFTNGRGMDLVLLTADAQSNDPLVLSAKLAKDKGKIVAVGATRLDAPRDLFYQKELELLVSRSYGPGRYDPLYEEGGIDYPYGHVRWTEKRNLDEFIRLLVTGQVRVGPLITHRIPVGDGPRAYEVITGKAKEPSLGVLFTYPPGARLATRVKTDLGTEKGVRPTCGGLGVLGAGNFANAVLLPLMKRSGTPLRGIATVSGHGAEAAARRFGFAFASTCAQEVLDDPETGMVAILTRHNLHAAQACAALGAGKHVFVEKPLCINRAELEAIREAKAKAPGLVIEVGFNRASAKYTREIADFFSGIAAPRSVLIRINAGALPPTHWLLDPEVGGGRLIGEGCHFIDWANRIVGTAPIEADCRPVGEGHGEQDWVLRLGYQDGSLAEIAYLSTGHPAAGKERFEVHAAGRTAILEDFRCLHLLGEGGKSTNRSWLRADKGHTAHLNGFLRAASGERDAATPWHLINSTMDACFAAQESLRTGRPIQLRPA